MGLKTTDYKIENMDITIPEAYARITGVSINSYGMAEAEFTIQTDRKSIGRKKAIDVRHLAYEIDKDLPIYEQLYVKAKENDFAGWEDDIVDVVATEEGEENAD